MSSGSGYATIPATRVLLVADATGPSRSECATVLGQAGYDVVSTTAREPVTDRPDVIIVRLNEPRRDLTFCRQVRTETATRDVPVIVVTAVDDPHMRDQIVRSGATSILIEPIRRVILLRHVRRLLARVRTHQPRRT